ncbi:eukaryotic translation initiation factor 5B-like [Ylistrum balloti]|uniref:eukaryotic translation initiation factor 5B-like n=1 Tax=Ylistrum balloti TaxID=509963 RepID=UPI002905C4FC|nr:eukaryotic translation initiation factor 5B-like [Ylistrum balloti]
MSESAFDKFLKDIQGFIEKTPDLSILIRKRYKECSQAYRNSTKFEDVLQITQAKIDSDNSRVFVHLRDFLNELKSNKADKKISKKRKRKESGSDISETPSPKSLRENSTDTDCSETENSSAFCEALYKVPPKSNSLSKISPKNKSTKSCVDESSDREKDINKTCDQVTDKAETKDIENNCETGSIKNGDCESSEPGKDQDFQGNQVSRDSVGDLCMTVDDSSDLAKTETTEKSKGCSGINGGFVNSPELFSGVLDNDCITIDDEEDNEDDPVLEKLEIKTEDICERLKETAPMDSSTPLKSEHSDENEKENYFPLKEKESCSENEKEIGVTLKNKSVDKTSEPVSEEKTKDIKRVETKQVENHVIKGNNTKFSSVAEQEDNENEVDYTEINEGTQPELAQPVTMNSSEETAKKGSQRQIRRLEKLLEDIRNKIEELKNADLSLDALGEEDSVYIQEDRYQHKFVKVWRKLCELKGAESTTGRPVERRFYYKGTRYPEVNRKLEKFVNKHKIFPDFHDVQKVIRDTSKQKKLGLSGPAIDRLAREAFQDIGDLLQKRRISDLRKTSPGHLQDEQGSREDPALRDPELKKKLDENRKAAKGKLDDVLEKFCRRQEESPEDVDVDEKAEEEEEEDKEEMEMMDKEDVPEMIEILNDDSEDDEETISTSPTKAATDGSSSSISFLSDNGRSSTPSKITRELNSPNVSVSAQKHLGKDRMAASPLSSQCSPQVCRKDSPCVSPKLPSSSSSLCSDSSPKPRSPYVANSPPGSPNGSDISDHIHCLNRPKKSGTLVSIEDYMDHMPVLPKVQTFPNLFNSETNDESLSDQCTLKISNVQSIAEDSSSTNDGQMNSGKGGEVSAGKDEQMNSVENSPKEKARRHLKWPLENGTSESTEHEKHNPCRSDANIDRLEEEKDSSNPPSPSPVKRSIMFRNSSRTVNLKPLTLGTTVIDLAGEDDTQSCSLSQKQQVAPPSPEEVIIVLSDSD